jgi:hypothetical protein
MYILCTLNIVIIVIVIIQFNTIQYYLLCTLALSIIVTLIVIVVVIKAWYSKFQFIICCSRVICFLNKSTSLNTKFAAKTHLADGEFLLQ